MGVRAAIHPAKQPVAKPTRPSSPGGGSAGDPSRQTTGSETHAAQFSRWGLGRRSIPAKQPVAKPTRRSAGDPSRLNRVAARRSSLRFGRNTPGPVRYPPSRALSAGRLAPTGRTGRRSPRRSSLRVGIHHRLPPPGELANLGAHRVARFAALCVAFRSKYTRYSFLTRLVSRAPRPHRENWPASALTWASPPAVSFPARGSRADRSG